MTADEIQRTGAKPWIWGTSDPTWMRSSHRPQIPAGWTLRRRGSQPSDSSSMAATPCKSWRCPTKSCIEGSGSAGSVRILTIVGTRPQLIKAAALSPELRARHQEIFVDTGQHYDEALAGVFFRELGLPKPDYSLGAGSGSHAEQTSAILRALGPIIAVRRPDAVLVYGDTNSPSRARSWQPRWMFQ